MDSSYIALNVDRIIEERHLSKMKFYADIGVTSAAFSKWRTGKSCPTMANLQRIAEVLDMPLSAIMRDGDESIKKEPVPENGNELTADEIEAIKLLSSFSPAERKEYIEFLRFKASRHNL